MARRTHTIPEGIVLPFRRSGQGIATAIGPHVTATQIRIVITTACKDAIKAGDLPYAQSMGTLIDRIKHAPVDDPTTQSRVIAFITDKIRKWVPTARLKDVSFQAYSEDEKLDVIITFDALDRPNGRTVAQDIEEAISL